MKSLLLFIVFALISFQAFSQINPDDFENFKSQNTDLSFDGLKVLYPGASDSYYKGYSNTPSFSNVLFLDSVSEKFSLTKDELELLNQNHFFISERLSYENFGRALHTIYANDLPLFISTDAILNALHCSYDKLLKNLEQQLMVNNLGQVLEELYNSYTSFAKQYEGEGIDESLKDVDLYLSVANSLITNTEKLPRIASLDSYTTVMNAIKAEKNVTISLFCGPSRLRDLDFSQFKVRGHYVYTDEDRIWDLPSLEPYFRTMMWLGRIELFLTAPAVNPWEVPWGKEEIRRMNIDAMLLNMLLNECSKKELFLVNETIINYLVGSSDNVTPAELTEYLAGKGISNVSDLLNDQVYDSYYGGFSLNPEFEQKIMGGMYFSNPYANKPDTLPVSFRLSGQRYIIDSEILANVVYDRIIYNGKKIHRGLPNPLDALFALGNSDAGYFLEDEIEEYHYATNLANLRYLVEHKEESFWGESLYNCWLGAIRELNPVEDDDSMPFFMRTSAWHQQKMNTQLASWAQLRHDNLLYAKPSYTGMTGCSYPCSYVEPYPDFYAALATFADNAGQFISTLPIKGWDAQKIIEFFPNFAEVMRKLEALAVKELNDEPFSDDENKWLESFLIEGGGSGEPPYSGWYSELYLDPFDVVEWEYPVVDLHTQPTDEFGVYVGYVFHAATGKTNLGTFMIKKPGTHQYVAYTGAFSSYYEKITDNFLRLTDQDWTQLVNDNNVPIRPEWTAAYLADKKGSTSAICPELPFTYLVTDNNTQYLTSLLIFPNPVSTFLTIKGTPAPNVNFTVYDLTGKVCLKGETGRNTTFDFSNLKNGLYLLKFDRADIPAVKIIKQ
ncbi:MAG: DUF3160 domain-containing protein [Prolixibacteraceae bacterium]|nr:DUF3160 domain-containing protein [Prolixibacteraceae bacterium]